jgi:cellulose biosynthesis protein BcsQ
MVKKIALFNHKGGVSKTTTTFHLGWMLASKGKKVILVDADPQSNLTGLVLGATRFEELYQVEKQRNFKAGLAPAFESRPIPIQAVDCIPVTEQEGLYLLPGHLQLSEYDVTLGIAQELSGSIQTLQNLPGSISYLLNITAEKYQADYMLIDMNPSLSAFNQNLLMTSDFFILPAGPDYFSVMAIEALANILPSWYAWSKRAQSLEVLQNAAYPFPNVTPKFLGTIIQSFRLYDGKPAKAFRDWIEKLNAAVVNVLVPKLEKVDMMLPSSSYFAKVVKDGYCLAKIADFNTLAAKSQEFNTPVFELTEDQLKQVGVFLEAAKKSRDSFRDTFAKLADEVINSTNYAFSY